MQTAIVNIGHQYFKFEKLVEYEAEVAEEDGLNSLFQKFISNYQKVYEQESDNGNEDSDRGIIFTDKYFLLLLLFKQSFCIV